MEPPPDRERHEAWILAATALCWCLAPLGLAFSYGLGWRVLGRGLVLAHLPASTFEACLGPVVLVCMIIGMRQVAATWRRDADVGFVVGILALLLWGLGIGVLPGWALHP